MFKIDDYKNNFLAMVMNQFVYLFIDRFNWNIEYHYT